MNNIDWSLIRSFLAVARLGSLSSAARELGVSQPTLSRDIQAIEKQTALNLFRRTTLGLQLTEAGQSLVESAGTMDTAADRFARQVAGMSMELEGNVRLSVNEILGTYLLPAALTIFRQQHPGVQVEVVMTNATSSLSKREADIALRMFQPTQPDLVARHVADMPIGFYAHRDYLAQHGTPTNISEFKQHTIIGFDEGMDFIEGGAHLGYVFTRKHFALRTDNLILQHNLARAGAGIVGTHIGLAQYWPELERLLEDIPLPSYPLWLVCHADVQYNQRIRAMMQFLGEWFADDPYRHALI